LLESLTSIIKLVKLYFKFRQIKLITLLKTKICYMMLFVTLVEIFGKNLGFKGRCCWGKTGCLGLLHTTETLAKTGIETYLFERKLDNHKPCIRAVSLCIVNELDLSLEIIDLRVRKMKMSYSTSLINVAVDINTKLDNEYIGMYPGEILYGLLCECAVSLGANWINKTVY
ncbi:MAG: hypothetical protein ACP8RL_09095, partial [cyanobacterium endosymbiont of Rhopalodia inflata]